jgi:putative heme-binding domain-containing protein
LQLAHDADAAVRRASLASLRLLKEPRAVPLAVAALADPQTERSALECLADLGGPEQAGDVVELAKRKPAADVLPQVLRMLTAWASRPGADRSQLERWMAEVQGAGGTLARWQIAGPLEADAAARLAGRLTQLAPVSPSPNVEGPERKIEFGSGTELRIALHAADGSKTGTDWLAQTEFSVGEPADAQFLAGGDGGLRIWLNGRLAHQRDEVRAFEPDSDRFDARLEEGTNRVLVQISSDLGNPAFHLRFRTKNSTVEHERLTQSALTRPGDVERGRALFHRVERSQCAKCHRIAGQGERIGPELTGVGNRFSRIHLVESILQPSRHIAPGFQAVTLALADGLTLTGVVVAENERQLTLADHQGKRHEIEKSEIEARQPQSISLMPEGLEKPLSVDEFVDLIAFLASQKDER